MNRVIHFELQADNVDRAKAFYEKALNWKITQAMTKETGGMDYWTIDTGTGHGIGGGIYRRDAHPEKFHTFDCTIGVESIDKALADIQVAGGEIVQEKGEIPGVGIFATCKDTEGNRFGIMQPTGWKPKL